MPINQGVSPYLRSHDPVGGAHIVKGYIMPNDEKEADRLDIWNQLVLVTLDQRLHLAPIKHPQRVLDVGTGTGVREYHLV